MHTYILWRNVKRLCSQVNSLIAINTRQDKESTYTMYKYIKWWSFPISHVFLPGPFASLSIRRPNLKITALSYSGTTFKQKGGHYHTSLIIHGALVGPTLISIINENGKNNRTRKTETTMRTTVHKVEPQPADSSWSSQPWMG